MFLFAAVAVATDGRCGQREGLINLRALDEPEWCNTDPARRTDSDLCRRHYVSTYHQDLDVIKGQWCTPGTGDKTGKCVVEDVPFECPYLSASTLKVNGCGDEPEVECGSDPVTDTAAVRCCSWEGTGVTSVCTEEIFPNNFDEPLTGGDGTEVTITQAERECAARGMRLCTAAELQARAGCGTGCGHNYRLIHSSTLCAPEPSADWLAPGGVQGACRTRECGPLPEGTPVECAGDMLGAHTIFHETERWCREKCLSEPLSLAYEFWSGGASKKDWCEIHYGEVSHTASVEGPPRYCFLKPA